MSDEYIIDTTPDPYDDTPDAYAQYYGSNDSNSPYSLRNRKFFPYSTNTMKKKEKEK